MCADVFHYRYRCRFLLELYFVLQLPFWLPQKIWNLMCNDCGWDGTETLRNYQSCEVSRDTKISGRRIGNVAVRREFLNTFFSGYFPLEEQQSSIRISGPWGFTGSLLFAMFPSTFFANKSRCTPKNIFQPRFIRAQLHGKWHCFPHASGGDGMCLMAQPTMPQKRNGKRTNCNNETTKT